MPSTDRESLATLHHQTCARVHGGDGARHVVETIVQARRLHSIDTEDPAHCTRTWTSGPATAK